MGPSFSKPVDDSLAKTPPKGEWQGETLQETRPKGEAPSKRKRAREAAILVLTFTSIISEAHDMLRPMKAVSEFIKKILEVAKVSFILPDDISLFTKSQSACRR